MNDNTYIFLILFNNKPNIILLLELIHLICLYLKEKKKKKTLTEMSKAS